MFAMVHLDDYPESHRLRGEQLNLFILRLKGDSMVDP